MADPQFLRVETSGGVFTITLDRPKANAFHGPMIEELLDALRHAGSDPAVRCVVLTGGGSVFSAGQDVAAFAKAGGRVSFREHLAKTYNRVITRMRELEKPIVGAINGAAAGAGLGIALATDLRIAARRARFVFGFTGIGLTSDSGTSLTLPLLVGLARAAEIAFTNNPVSSETALAYGLVNRVVEDGELPAAAAELAGTIARGPTRALGLTKRAFNRAHMSELDAILTYEGHLQEIAGLTEDHREGVAAFLEKRPPVYEGK